METQNNKRSRLINLDSSEQKNKIMRINSNDISYYDEKWPDKIVILITSHGSFSKVDVEENTEVQTIKVPEGIKINYLYASSHGSVTAYTENDAKLLFNFIKSHISELLSDNPADKKTALSQYSNIMMNAKDNAFNKGTNDIKNYKQLLENSKQLYNKQTKKNKKYKEQINEMTKPLIPFIYQHNKEQKNINNSYSKGFTYKTYNENELIPNKRFFRGIRDIFSGKNIDLKKYNYAIRIMNLKNQPDILDLLQPNRYKKGGIFGVDETPTITTQQLIEICIQHGVKEIIIIDSACGSIDGNDRELRNIRRSINREPNVNFLLNKQNTKGGTYKKLKKYKSKKNKTQKNYKNK